MFARKVTLQVAGAGEPEPVPMAWLDEFFMRNFTGFSAFDDTLPAGDGLLEIGFEVEPEQLRAQFEKWLRGRKKIGPDTAISLSG